MARNYVSSDAPALRRPARDGYDVSFGRALRTPRTRRVDLDSIGWVAPSSKLEKRAFASGAESVGTVFAGRSLPVKVARQAVVRVERWVRVFADVSAPDYTYPGARERIVAAAAQIAAGRRVAERAVLHAVPAGMKVARI